MLEERLCAWAAGRGYRVAIARTDIVAVVRAKLEKRRTDGLIDRGFFQENLAGFRYLDDAAIEGPARVVIVATPSPIAVLPLVAAGRRVEGLIPPTYVRYKATFDAVLADMKINALGEGVRAEILKAPLKSLAVHMGLVAYGRNNVTYASGMGSGLQLNGYLISAGEGADRSAEGSGVVSGASGPAKGQGRESGTERMLERCADCRACVRACPTGAIHADRFLISAERCYTLHSESPKPMPSWITAPRRLSLIGCLACQEACPENKGRLKTEPSGVELSEDETGALLESGRRLDRGVGAGPGEGRRASEAENQPPTPALASARAKFATLGMSEDFEVVGRNLALFLESGL